jgi:hypothetical protein
MTVPADTDVASNAPAVRTAGPPGRGSTEDRNVAGALRSDEHALMWLLDLVSPVLPQPNGRVRQYGVLPRPEAPRYLIPLDAPRTSATLLVRPGNARVLSQRAMRFVLRVALRLGVVPFFRRRVSVPDGDVDSPSLIQWLERELGRRDLVMAVAIGPPRPNRKPIVQVMTTDGSPVCYGKIAVDEHTSQLVRNESAFLAAHKPGGFVVPALLALDTWKGRDIALLSVLTLDEHHRAAPFLELTPEIILEIARLMPVRECGVLTSPWWASAMERCASQDGTQREDLKRYVEKLGDQLVGISWTFGAWHGDLTPWNAKWVSGRLHIWDWERTGGPVPLGFDAVHAEFQVAHLNEGLPVAEAAAQVVTARGPLLERLGIARDQLGLLVGCYRLELSLRLLDAARYGSIGSFGPLVDELLTAPIQVRRSR